MGNTMQVEDDGPWGNCNVLYCIVWGKSKFLILEVLICISLNGKTESKFVCALRGIQVKVDCRKRLLEQN